MVKKVTGALEEIVIAWRDHVAWPSSVADIRELMKTGPAPVDTTGSTAAPASGGTSAPAAGGDGTGFDLNTLVPTMTANRDLGHTGLSDLADVDDIPGLSAKQRDNLHEAGFVSVGDVRGSAVEALAAVPGIDAKALEILKTA